MNSTFKIVTAALAAIVLLSGCASSEDGSRSTFAEWWKKNAEKQDADARAFVSTD